MKYSVNHKTISYHAQGKTIRGEAGVLLNNAIDLTAQTSWHEAGLTLETLFPATTHSTFKKNIRKLLLRLWRDAGLNVPDAFPLDQYHTVASTHDKHQSAIEKTRLLSLQDFPSGVGEIESRISEICGTSLIAKNPFDNQEIFHFRIIRPNSTDNNPLHRDVWLEDFDNCINLYIPVAGSNEHSSLIILPGSHLWPESRIERTEAGALINGIQFNVPAITSIDGAYTIVRPDPQEIEVLIFSPYLIHGGAVNFNTDKTRISIEMRLWKK